MFAALAQLVEQLPRKEQVSSSILLGGSVKTQFSLTPYEPSQAMQLGADTLKTSLNPKGNTVKRSWNLLLAISAIGLVLVGQVSGAVASNSPSSVHVSVGYGHACAIKNAGTVTCWGQNNFGQSTVPLDLEPSAQISLSGWHSCALSASGNARCWGWNQFGQASVPNELGPVNQLVAGDAHTCAVTQSAQVRCWGNDWYGQIDVPSDLGAVKQVSLGYRHTCALTSSGQVRCWGWNVYGQTDIPADLGLVSQISAGNNTTCAVQVSGVLRCWGDNEQHQLELPAGLDSVLQVSVGAYHVCAITKVKDLRCWGLNSSGQSSVPTNLGSVSEISANYFSTCAVAYSSEIRCWGDNSSGQTETPFPIQMPGTNHYYLFVKGSFTLNQARQLAESQSYLGLKGHLATISSEQENSWLKSVSPHMISWVGAIDAGPDQVNRRNWVWQAGQEINAKFTVCSADFWANSCTNYAGTFNDWNTSTGQPDGRGQDLGMVFAPGYYAGGSWFDAPPSEQDGYLVEFEERSFSTAQLASQNWAQVASNADGTKLAAIAAGGSIWLSSNSGQSWTESISSGVRNWSSIQLNGDGSKVVASVMQGSIWTSDDFGATWTERANAGTRKWYRLASSADGVKLAAVVYDGAIWTSNDSGVNWVERSSSGSRYWSAIASNSDGSKLVADVNPGGVWTSSDSGVTWIERTNAGSRDWGAVASNADGTKLIASWNNGNISTSNDSGNTWTVRTVPSSYGWWRSLASSADGTRLYAVEWCGGVWESKDAGATWAKNEQFGTKAWYSINVSADGSRIIAGTFADGCGGPNIEGKLTIGVSLNKFSLNETPSIQGIKSVGSRLQAKVGSYPTGTSLTYQWRRDGLEISGSNSSKYLITGADVDHSITVEVVASKPGYETLTSTSSPFDISKSRFATFSKPVVIGSRKFGSTLWSNVAARGSGVNFTYQWLRDGSPIAGAAGRSYDLDVADLNTDISFRVCGSKTYYETACVTSDSKGLVSLGQIAKRPLARIWFNSTKIGSVVEGKPGNWQSDVNVSYSWLRDGVPIQGETSLTHTVTQADRGHTLAFQVTGSKVGYLDFVSTSPPKKIS